MSPSNDPFRLAPLHRVDRTSPLAELNAITDPDFINRFNHGDLERWLGVLARLPSLQHRSLDLQSRVRIGSAEEAGGQAEALEKLLKTFIPWRKGPFELFGVQIDSEWQSGMKWDRLLPHVASLKGHRVLDVGCGNGYHCWRAVGEGASLVIGVEPYLLYVMQFLAIKHFLPDLSCYLLPVQMARYPGPFRYYDTVFSMGVIYHVRSPIDHLLQLKKCLRPGGQLILESLVVEGGEGYSLTPADRYARMPNVWFIPSVATLNRWLARCGFTDIHTVDVTVTTEQEQRRTPWMPFQSMVDGLDSVDPARTCEGLPAPKRAILLARTRN